MTPVSLHNYSPTRFHGESRCCSLSEFSERDAATLVELYKVILRVSETVRPNAPSPLSNSGAEMAGRLRALAHSVSFEGSPKDSQLLQGIRHDVTGGSLTVLHWTLSDGLSDPDRDKTIRFLALDHLKIMRNAVRGLDEERREGDVSGGFHGIPYLRQRWANARLGNGRGVVQIQFSGDGETPFAENCFEFSTVQRVLYNLIANACTHTADQAVDLEVLEPGNRSSPGSVRFAVSNRATPELQERLGIIDDLTTLFRDRVSTTGGGLGLGVCADLVRQAYGLESMEEALEDGYVGIQLQSGRVTSWFHWPSLPADARDARAPRVTPRQAI